jgi:hypothetical protein
MFGLSYLKLGLIGLAGIAALTLWQADRRSQYQLGIAAANAEFQKIIQTSEGLIGNEKDAASAAATAAARKLCEQEGADPSACTDL